jgi:hypothetical protein
MNFFKRFFKSSQLDILEDALQDAKNNYLAACIEYEKTGSSDALKSVFETDLVYAEAHIKYSVEYSKFLS